jgi:hypothetical protein
MRQQSNLKLSQAYHAFGDDKHYEPRQILQTHVVGRGKLISLQAPRRLGVISFSVNVHQVASTSTAPHQPSSQQGTSNSQEYQQPLTR